MICNCTGVVLWKIDNEFRLLIDITNGILPGHNLTGTNILVYSPVNNTEYVCVSPTTDPAVNSIYSDPAYIVIAGETLSHLCTYLYTTLCIHIILACVHKYMYAGIHVSLINSIPSYKLKDSYIPNPILSILLLQFCHT